MRTTSVRLRHALAATVAVAFLATATAVCAAPQHKPAAAKGAAKRPAGRATAKKAAAPGPDVYAGYSYTHAGEASLNGWALAGGYPLGDRLRLVVDVTGHYGSFAGASLSQTALMAGARGVWSWHGLRPFAEGLGGLAHSGVSVSGLSDSSTAWGIALGGGADYPFSESWAVRGLAHLRFLHGQGTWDTDPRLSIGVVYTLGR